jgi:hypothetical protein
MDVFFCAIAICATKIGRRFVGTETDPFQVIQVTAEKLAN